MLQEVCKILREQFAYLRDTSKIGDQELELHVREVFRNWLQRVKTKQRRAGKQMAESAALRLESENQALESGTEGGRNQSSNAGTSVPANLISTLSSRTAKCFPPSL